MAILIKFYIKNSNLKKILKSKSDSNILQNAPKCII